MRLPFFCRLFFAIIQIEPTPSGDVDSDKKNQWRMDYTTHIAFIHVTIVKCFFVSIFNCNRIFVRGRRVPKNGQRTKGWESIFRLVVIQMDYDAERSTAPSFEKIIMYTARGRQENAKIQIFLPSSSEGREKIR